VETNAFSGKGNDSIGAPPVVIQTVSITLGGAGSKQSVGINDCVGFDDGALEGEDEGELDGLPLGDDEGDDDGELEGDDDGELDGLELGALDGLPLGDDDGEDDGDDEGSALNDGESLGALLG